MKLFFYTHDGVSPYQFSLPVSAKKSAAHNRPSDARIRMEQHTEAAHSAKRRFPQNQRPANAPFPLAYKQRAPDNAQAHSVPAHEPAPSGAPLPLQAVIEKPCLFPLSRALFHRTQRAPNRKRTQALHPHPSSHPAHKSRTRKRAPDKAQARSVPAINRPTRRAHSPSNRHRKNLPVPAIPRSISQNAKSAGQESNSGAPPSSVAPSGAQITHTQTRAGQCASPQRPRHAPAPPGALIRLQSVIEKTCLFPLSRALFHRTQRAPDRERAQASRPHPSSHPARESRTRTRAPDKARSHSVPAMNRPARRAHSPSIRHRKALPVPFPALYFAERKERRTGNELRHPALIRHPIRRANCAAHKRTPDKAQSTAFPPCPAPSGAHSLAYGSIIALPCGAFRASSAARR